MLRRGTVRLLAPATLVSAILVFAPVVTALLGSVILKKAVVGQQHELISSHYRYDAGFKKQDAKQ